MPGASNLKDSTAWLEEVTGHKLEGEIVITVPVHQRASWDIEAEASLRKESHWRKSAHTG